MERTFLLFLLEVTAKATTILAVAGLACWMLGRASAAVRHFIWAVATAGVLVLPVLSVMMPKWDVDVPALAPAPAPASQPAKAARFVPQWATAPTMSIERPASLPRSARRTNNETLASRSRDTRVSARSEPLNTPSDHPFAGSDARRPTGSPDVPAPSLARGVAAVHSPEAALTDTERPMSIAFMLLALWMAGVAVALGRFLAGHLRLWWIQRHMDPITDPTWIELSTRVARQLCLPTVVRLLRCRRPTMPVCWGVRRPALLLPADADTWTVERRKIVLLHELAHAKRRDCLTQAIGQLAVAVHWFNPLVWLAVRRLRAERERACDDLVLAAGASAPEYADHLLEIARNFRTVGCPSWAAVAMARSSQLEGRLLAILDRHRDRRTLTRRACAAAAALAVVMVGTLAAVQPAPAPAASDARSSSQAVSKSRPHPTPADASGTATAAILSMFDGQPVPMPVPRPLIVPNIEIVPNIKIDGIDLLDLEFEIDGALEGIGEGVGEGIGHGIAGGIEGGVRGGVIGGVMGGVGKFKLLEAEQAALQAAQEVDAEFIAQDALRNLDVEKIAIESAESALAQIANVEITRDDRPEADPRIVTALAAALKDQSVEVRRQAAVTLSQMRSAHALDALIAATTDADKEVRQFAVQAISRHKSDAVTKALVRALKDTDAGVRKAAMHGVSRQRDPQYIDVFVEALKDADPEVRQHAAHALAQYRDTRAVPGLIIALKDANPEVRQQAAHALGQLGDVRAIDPLVAAMKDANAEVREHVVHALGRIGRSAREKGRE